MEPVHTAVHLISWNQFTQLYISLAAPHELTQPANPYLQGVKASQNTPVPGPAADLTL